MMPSIDVFTRDCFDPNAVPTVNSYSWASGRLKVGDTILHTRLVPGAQPEMSSYQASLSDVERFGE
jgi:hypothetical protein